MKLRPRSQHVTPHTAFFYAILIGKVSVHLHQFLPWESPKKTQSEKKKHVQLIKSGQRTGQRLGQNTCALKMYIGFPSGKDIPKKTKK